MKRIWKLKEATIQQVPPELVEAAGNLPVLAKLLAIRGITNPKEAHAFLNPETYQPTPGTEFPEMEKAVSRIGQAMAKGEHILIYGDFDVDGITGTSVLMDALRQLGANVSYYVPDRHTEGHGLNTAALCRLVSSRQAKVVITTDTGITNFNEVNLLNGLGVDTIITDHHELPENLPQAYATLNPKLLSSKSPLAYLSGVGVAYKLCEALFEAAGASRAPIDALLDLVAIGTVVDMVPLLRENRYLVWRGLQVLQRRERPGVKAILQEANFNDTAPVDSQTLGFVIGPRLNAIGRLAHAGEAVELLTTGDPEEAKQLAAKLEQFNRQRKTLVEQCLLQADTHLISTGELTDQKAVILSSRDWNPGVVGLVATRLIEKYNRPCFIGFIDDDTQEIRFSARSIEGFDMHRNLQDLEDLFIRWGGHSGAAGFSIAQHNLQKLKSRLFKLCAERIGDEQLVPVTWIDMMLSPSQVNPYLVEVVNKMAPFGQENPLPVFGLEQMTIGAQRLMGEDQRHLKLVLTHPQNKGYLEAIRWNAAEDEVKLNPKDKYRFAFIADLNTYNGLTKVQLILKDLQNESERASLASQAMTQTPGNVAHPAARGAEVKPPEAPVASSASVCRDVVMPLSGDDLQWVDHRGRDEIESFLTQMLSATAAGESEPVPYRIYCEGTRQYLPIPMTEAMFCGRNGAPPDRAVQNLILWDLPPDMQSLFRLLSTQQPRTVHLIGGKYEKIPLYRSPKEVLDGFLKVLQRQAQGQEQNMPINVDLAQLGATLSTTLRVVVSGLSLLNRLGLVTATVLAQDEKIQVRLHPVPSAEPPEISQTIEYIGFAQALREVCRFREWLMTAPLPVIQSAVALEKSAGISVLSVEREQHAIHIR